MNKIQPKLLIFALLFLAFARAVPAQATAFTYQGRLSDNSMQASGSYDFHFALFDALTGGTEIGINDKINVAVSNGVFTVQLDFGAEGFPGANRFLEISLKRSNSPVGTEYTVLTPRQPITSTPYAIRSLSAANADHATSAANAQNAANLDGTAANQFVQTTDTRLTDARAPAAGSGFYIQNQNSAAQTSASFNIDGAGAANIFNATTQYNIGGNRVLSINGANNLFAGRNAGSSNTTGEQNTFVGEAAGQANTTGRENVFFGFNTGYSNTTGSFNSFFGRNVGSANVAGGSNSFVGFNAGFANTGGSFNSFFGREAGYNNTTGALNSFVGYNAGTQNTTGYGNTLIGYNAGVGSGNVLYGTAIGANAVVSQNDSIVLGKVAGSYLNSTGQLESRSADSVIISGNLSVAGTLSGSGSGLTNLNASNILTGTLSAARLPNLSASYIQNSTTQQTGNFNISSTGAANIFDATRQFNIAGSRVLSTPGTENLFVGSGTGSASFSGSGNSFVGVNSGSGTTTGNSNSFFGKNAGVNNISGTNNTVIGAGADVSNSGLTYATAIGAGTYVYSSNTIAIGRVTLEDTTRIYGTLALNSVAGGTNASQLCLNQSQIVVLCSSSLRYKTNIASYTAGLDLIKRLKPISFDWRDGGMKDIGFGAEDVAAINPLFAVYGNKGEIQGVKYDRMSVLFVNAFKEQQTQIEEQNTQIERQQKQIDELRQIVCAMKPEVKICQPEEK